MAIANGILTQREDYGESREDLEKEWEKWVHHLPFDAPVAEALAKLYERRLERLDREEDAGPYQRLERKLRLVKSRAHRYRTDPFGQGQ
ncbi:MAG: hypothetical protein GTO40_02830 [Deltaproteobacteria bacterium]|nr:hypothetical protein [Deltaproteobacteria bacterium]